MTSPVKKPVLQKRKGAPQATQVYRQVVKQALAIIEHGEAIVGNIDGEGTSEPTALDAGNLNESLFERESKKKKPTPPSSESSAAAASQLCPSQ